MFPMVFDLHGVDRIAEWKLFRETLENCKDPLADVVKLWSKAPFVSPYLDPDNPKTWPDPWHLILDLKLDDLAISLGMYYTLKLTRRFMTTPIEIHMTMLPETDETKFPVIVDHQWALNWQYNFVVPASSLPPKTSLIYPKTDAL